MATGRLPSINDTEYNLWAKIAQNMYTFALDAGGTGLTPPNINDSEDILAKKTCYSSAVALDKLAP